MRPFLSTLSMLHAVDYQRACSALIYYAIHSKVDNHTKTCNVYVERDNG